jgi:trans-2-enoyl-CoA reductase
MASHGAAKDAASKSRIPTGEQGLKSHGKFHHLEIHPAANGGASVHHIHSYPEGGGVMHEPKEVHVFGEGDGHKLAAHIEKHIGIDMPGKAKGTVAERAEGEEGMD